MTDFDIHERLREIHTLVDDFIVLNQSHIHTSRQFVDWIFDMCRMHMHDTTNISLIDMLIAVQLPYNLDYFGTTFQKQRDNVHFDIDDLINRINAIANNIRTYGDIYLRDDDDDDNDDDNDDNDNDDDYEDNDDEDNDDDDDVSFVFTNIQDTTETIDVNSLSFTEFE